MSRKLISHSPDLKRLQDEGFELDIIAGHVLVRHVPYVNAQRQVCYGTLVSTLTLGGERTARPDTHVIFFEGDQPCDKDGREIGAIVHEKKPKILADGLRVDRSFSNKPKAGYSDYYEKLSTYANILSGPAEALDPQATARTFVVEAADPQLVFTYTDTATARAEIGAATGKLDGHRIGIIGLGGTGSYVLDLLAKTPVAEIHLFDPDRFLQHNAFRAPGAPSLDELRALRPKVEHFRDIYSRMHRGLVAHPEAVSAANAALLDPLDFVFICVDSGAARKSIIGLLNDRDKPFIDVGMGLELVEESQALIGQLRVSTSTPGFRDSEQRIPQASGSADDAYCTNIQIADLNCISAGLAVLRWKKLCGFYQDLENEHLSIYALNVNQLLSEDTPNE